MNNSVPGILFRRALSKRNAMLIVSRFRVKPFFAPREWVDGVRRSQWLVHCVLWGEVGVRKFDLGVYGNWREDLAAWQFDPEVRNCGNLLVILLPDGTKFNPLSFSVPFVSYQLGNLLRDRDNAKDRVLDPISAAEIHCTTSFFLSLTIGICSYLLSSFLLLLVSLTPLNAFHFWRL